MNRPNRILLCSGLLALLVGAALFIPAPAYGSGGSTWSMTVTNPTQWPARVKFWYQGDGLTHTGYVTTIPSGGFYTFKVPGAKCPHGFTGSLTMPDGRQAGLRSTNGLGNEASDEYFSACCWNLNFTICRKVAPTDDPYVRDKDYGFCKN